MVLIRLAAGLFLVLWSMSATLAAPMSCAAFNESLLRAIRAAGDKVAAPRFELANKGTMWDRSDLKDILGLSGNLMCRKDGNLDSIDAVAELVPDQSILQLVRLENLAAAMVCAVADGWRPARCKAAVQRLANEAVKDFARAMVRGEVAMLGESQHLPLPGGFDMQAIGRDNELSFVLAAPY